MHGASGAIASATDFWPKCNGCNRRCKASAKGVGFLRTPPLLALQFCSGRPQR